MCLLPKTSGIKSLDFLSLERPLSKIYGVGVFSSLRCSLGS